MFGYVLVNQPELKIREFKTYHSYYCGLCHVLGKKFGFLERICVNYDLTFLSIFLTSLYETEEKISNKRCPVHPMKKRKVTVTKYTGYCAEMLLYLTYLKCMDDWKDEKKVAGYGYGMAVKQHVKKIEKSIRKNAQESTVI